MGEEGRREIAVFINEQQERSLVVGPWGDSTVEQLDHISTRILVLIPSRLFLFFKMDVCIWGRRLKE